MNKLRVTVCIRAIEQGKKASKFVVFDMKIYINLMLRMSFYANVMWTHLMPDQNHIHQCWQPIRLSISLYNNYGIGCIVHTINIHERPELKPWRKRRQSRHYFQFITFSIPSSNTTIPANDVTAPTLNTTINVLLCRIMFELYLKWNVITLPMLYMACDGGHVYINDFEIQWW